MIRAVAILLFMISAVNAGAATGTNAPCGGLGQGPCPGDPVAKLSRDQRAQLLAEARKRCRAGEAKFCAAGGNLLMQDGDAKGALELLGRGCEKGAVAGCLIGAELSMGRGDLKTGIRLLKAGCKRGDQEACLRADQAQAVEERARREDRLVKQACARSEEAADCHYHRGLAKSARLDAEGARSELGRACEMKLMKACLAQGMFEAQAGHQTEALRLLELACRGGEAAGCRILDQAKANSAGSGTPKPSNIPVK